MASGGDTQQQAALWLRVWRPKAEASRWTEVVEDLMSSSWGDCSGPSKEQNGNDQEEGEEGHQRENRDLCEHG